MAGTNTIKQQAAGAGATGAGQAKAALQVFAGGACYGAMATTYKLAYAAGFTSAQVAASSSPSPRSQGTHSGTAGSAWAGSSPLSSWAWEPSPASPQSSTATP